MAGPRIPNIDWMQGAGINPETGRPIKAGDPIHSSEMKDAVKRLLRIKDEQQAIRRFRWYNLPSGLDGQLLERILYYKYEGMFFYMPVVDKFYFLPFTLEGDIDVYGRFTGVTPLPFNGVAQTNAGEKKAPKPWITGLVKQPIYSLSDLFEKPEETDVEHILADGCVLLCDYSKQVSQNGLARQLLNDKILDAEADLIPYMNTALLNNTGVKSVRVNNQDEYSNVVALNLTTKKAALEGSRFLPAIGISEFQDFGEGKGTLEAAAAFMQAMESIDNFRLGTMGINNGGLFQKQAHMLQTEQNLASGADSFCLDDGLIQRQTFCDIVNAIWGLGIWCELSENVIGDTNADGKVADGSEETSGPGDVAPSQGGASTDVQQ